MKELKNNKGKLYSEVGLEDDWTIVDFPNLAPKEDWSKMWQEFKEVLKTDMEGMPYKTSKLKVKTSRLSAFDMLIYRYKRWMTNPNENYVGEVEGDQTLPGQQALFEPPEKKEVNELDVSEIPARNSRLKEEVPRGNTF